MRPIGLTVASVWWLDCSGPSYNTGWDELYENLINAKDKSQADLHEVVWSNVAHFKALLGDRDAILENQLKFNAVLEGDAYPTDLNGYCHLGLVVMYYLLGTSSSLQEWVQEAWRILTHPVDQWLVFDLLESSRWANLAQHDDVLSAAADLTSGTWRPQIAKIPMPSNELRFYLRCSAPVQRSGWSNLVVAAVSTHAAIMEPVASLRWHLQQRGANLVAHYLGLMHPTSELPCKMHGQQEFSICGGFQGDHVLHVLGDMLDRRYLDSGFSAELGSRVSLLHSRHILGIADLIICAHPFLLCSVLRPFSELFMLIYLTPTPLAFVPPGAERMWVLVHLSALTSHSATMLIAASSVYALHVQWQMGAQVPVARPAARYVRDVYQWHGKGKRQHVIYIWYMAASMTGFIVGAQNFVVQSREQGLIHSLLEIKIKELLITEDGMASWQYLSGVRCVVLLPWDLQLTSFPELYALAVPLLLPTAAYIASYGVRILKGYGMHFWSVNPAFAGGLLGKYSQNSTEKFDHSPWLHADWGDDGVSILKGRGLIEYWLQASDFESFGHTMRFDSIPNMILHAAAPEGELQEKSNKMRAEWKLSWAKTAEIYDLAAKCLTSGNG